MWISVIHLFTIIWDIFYVTFVSCFALWQYVFSSFLHNLLHNKFISFPGGVCHLCNDLSSFWSLTIVYYPKRLSYLKLYQLSIPPVVLHYDVFFFPSPSSPGEYGIIICFHFDILILRHKDFKHVGLYVILTKFDIMFFIVVDSERFTSRHTVCDKIPDIYLTR